MNISLMNIFKLNFFLAAFILLITRSTYAIRIDEFEGSGSIIADQNNVNFTTVVNNPSAIGGTRSMYVRKSAGNGEIFLRTSGGSLRQDQGVNDTGISLITWDGDNIADTGTPSNPTGLGGFDLYEDSLSNPADSFVLKVIADLGFNQPITLKLYVYTNATKGSVVSYTINADLLSLTDIVIPYANFTAISSPGFTAADFHNVGSIVLEISGTNPANDIVIESLKTNGNCDIFPVNGDVVSACNKCINDPAANSCIDCVGTPFGNVKPGDQCDTGDLGVCKDGLYGSQKTFIINHQNCSCTQITQPGPEICDNKDNDCDGQTDEGLYDVCGICGGNGQSCLDCEGTPFGTKVKDICNVCGGNGTSCLDCAGTPFGTKTKDLCGVCDGDNSTCKDCAGTPNGTKTKDQCGVCGGDGKSCLDCAGTINGTKKLDQCGVCGGNNTSCLDCTDRDISETQFNMDHGAKLHEKLIDKMLKTLTNKDKSAKTKAYATATATKVHTLQIRNWVLSWTLVSKITVCGNTTLCTQSSNEPILNEYRKHSSELLAVGNEVIAKLKKLKVKTSSLSKSNLARHNSNISLSNTVPASISTGCNI